MHRECDIGVQGGVMMMRWIAMAFVAGLGIAAVAHAAGKPCSFALRSFGDGAVSCQGGRQFRCADGAWQNVGSTCADEDPGDAGAGVRPGVNEPRVKEPGVKQPGPPSVP
jgi:hypothetical protein